MKIFVAMLLVVTLGMVGSAHAVKTDPVLIPKVDGGAKVSLNLTPAMEMVSALENKGVKVGSKVIESGSITYLQLTLNGKPISPIMIDCKDCIEFEY